ncbi:MAG: hypothetical protein ACTSQH_00040 [Candidatus Hodarchaeales archaeon]
MNLFKKAKKPSKVEEKPIKVEGKDPIKDKYLQEVGFFKKIQMKFSNFKESAKNNEDLMGDFHALMDILGSIAVYGILGTLFLGLFGFNFTISIILGVGSGLWILENKFIEFATRILGSVKIVQINN